MLLAMVVIALLALLSFGALSALAAVQGTAQITAPAANAQLSGVVTVTGTASAANFQFYKLEFGQGANPTQMSVIGSLQKAPVTGGTLGTWDVTKLPAGAYTLRLTVVDNTGNFITASQAVTVGAGAAAAATATPAPENPRRGCLACHVKLPPGAAPPGLPDGAFTLAWEAANAAPNHPRVSPSGVSLQPTDQTGPGPCLECHRPSGGGANDAGVGAPINLRNIAHPAMMFSETFINEFRGNCFSCHNIDGNGHFLVLGEAVEVDEHGIPQKLPIPGAFPALSVK